MLFCIFNRITFIYHNKAADIHLIISNLKIVFMLCVIEYLLKRTPNSTINIMFFILITFVIIDFASIGFISEWVISNRTDLE